MCFVVIKYSKKTKIVFHNLDIDAAFVCVCWRLVLSIKYIMLCI